jgi:dienelactone hydrolase
MRSVFRLGSLCGSACVAEAPALEFPPPDALPEVPELPDPFATWSDGDAVVDADDWVDVRRPELTALFAHYLYGHAAPDVGVTRITSVAPTSSAGGTLRQYVADTADGPFTVALWTPAGDGPFPVVLGLDKCGNTEVSDDPAVRDGGGWDDPTCTGARGERATYWALDVALAAGVGVAVVHQSDFAPDDRDAAVYDAADDDADQGAIGRWARGLSLAVDVLERSDVVDPDRIWLTGHSRRGKAALWAAAQDERVAGVWAHQSGTLGAALSRVSTDGESVADVTSLFPHWFGPHAAAFGDAEARLPVDQHLLLALVAPRRVVIVDGADDAWADPEGARLAVEAATPVWSLVGGGATPLWIERPGGHEVTPDDWTLILPYVADDSSRGSSTSRVARGR